MNNLLKYLLIIFFFTSCNSTAIKQSFSSADSLVIHFKNEQEAIVTKTIQTTEAKAINRIIDFIDGKTVEDFKCGYNGKMFFYSKGLQVQEVDFNIKEETCTHFSLQVNGKLINTKMNMETVDFFDALEKGLPFY